jgi:hypothetical protein
MIHQFLHRLRDHNHHIIWLIVMYGPLHRVRYSLSRRPDVVVVSTLQDCLGLQDIFVGDLVRLDPDPMLIKLHPNLGLFLHIKP